MRSHGRYTKGIIEQKKKDLTRLGYLEVSDEEAFVYWLSEGNREVIDAIRDNAFRYSCLEAEVLGVRKKGVAFKIMCKINKSLMYDHVIVAAERAGSYGHVSINTLDDACLLNLIKTRLSKPLPPEVYKDIFGSARIDAYEKLIIPAGQR